MVLASIQWFVNCAKFHRISVKLVDSRFPLKLGQASQTEFRKDTLTYLHEIID